MQNKDNALNKRKLRSPKYSAGFEKKIYERWYEKDIFHMEPPGDKSGARPFVVVIPPPNITGRLHMGHALNNVLQDVMIRYNLMKGKKVKWVPGTDHGGIATQTVVEKSLLKEGIRKNDIGRREFLNRMEEWKKQYGGTILEQLKVLGCALDWKSIHFTMDETCSRAVKEAFVRLYNEGKIYRGRRLINYCVRCETSLSDIEVEYSEEKGHLWYIKYPFEDGSGSVTVATTRPETMLGDTAVAVNPSDERYSSLEGKMLVLPVAGRKIPLITDYAVEKGFGTGAVKVTPAHDFNDFEIGARHGLESLQVIDEQGLMTSEAGAEFEGLTRGEARKKILGILEEKGHLEKTEELDHSVSACYRCGEPIEPLLSLQWFLSMEELAAPAIKAVSSGAVRFYPDRWKQPFLNFLGNIRDWCLSRQIWWGHRLPVYYCKKCREKAAEDDSSTGIIVSVEKPEKCPVCGSTDIYQDEDVLDTWFSSGMWPFEVFGWPEKTPELEYFYPTSLLVTGHEILNLWVARMVMMGLKFAGGIPFDGVYIHGIVRDKDGKKMSKSLGNTIDPLDVTEKYGVDSLRYATVRQAVAGHDLLMSEDSFISSRNFMNKIWNAANVVIARGLHGKINFEDAKALPDRWILSEFSALMKEIDTALGVYDAARYSRLVYDFFWNRFCGWFLEILKLGADDYRKKLAYYLYRSLIAVLHPVVPFVTEEIYSTIRGASEPESILEVPWPEISFADDEAVSVMSELFALIQGIRNVRSNFRISNKTPFAAYVHANEEIKVAITENGYFVKPLARAGEISFSDIRADASSGFATGKLRCSIPLGGIVDIAAEVERMKKEIEEIAGREKKLKGLLSNEKFIANAGEKVIEEKKELLKVFEKKKKNISVFLKSLE